MARIRSLIATIDVVPAKKLCKCTHTKRHSIPKGSLRFVIKEPGGMGEKGYCVVCAKEMLLLARQRLDELDAAIDFDPPPRDLGALSCPT